MTTNNVQMDVIGYQCMVLVPDAKKPNTNISKPLGRRYNAKSAAEAMADLARKDGQQAYVREVIGPASRA